MNLFVYRGHKAGKSAIAENRGILKIRSRGNEFQCRGNELFIAAENRHPDNLVAVCHSVRAHMGGPKNLRFWIPTSLG